MEDAFEPSIFDYGDYGNSHPYRFEDWERNARLDGWACRTDNDCGWIDSYLGCDDYQFDINSIQV